MAELSPAAQAVLDAVTAELDWDARYHSHQAAAAALRAVADQVVPELDEPDRGACTDHQRKRAALLAIATELESLES